MWLFWLKTISIIVTVTSSIGAIYKEHYPSKKVTWLPNFLVYLAIVSGVVAIVAEIVGNVVQRELEQQHITDLKYIQILHTPVV